VGRFRCKAIANRQLLAPRLLNHLGKPIELHFSYKQRTPPFGKAPLEMSTASSGWRFTIPTRQAALR